MSRAFLLLSFLSIVSFAACGDSSEGPSDFSASEDLAVDLAVNTDASPRADLSCEGTGGCYTCAAKTDPEFLNHCTDSTCSAFDNKARLPLLLPNGGLPPLQN